MEVLLDLVGDADDRVAEDALAKDRVEVIFVQIVRRVLRHALDVLLCSGEIRQHVETAQLLGHEERVLLHQRVAIIIDMTDRIPYVPHFVEHFIDRHS